MAQGAVTFEDGHPIRLVGIVQDYTAQKQAEEQLAEQEQRFRLLAEINPIGIQHARSNGQIIYCNPAYCALTGYELEEFVSGKVTWIDLTPPEWLTLDEAKAREARGQGGVCVPYEKEYIRKDGTRIPVLVGFALITKESDESVAFIIDRSQLRKSQQLLDAAQQRAELLAQMLDSSTQPFGAGTLDGKMVLFNKAYQELTGYSEEELRHATWSDDLTPPEWREAEQKVLEQLTQSGVPQVYEKEYVRKDGTRVPIEIRVNMATSKSDGKQLYYGFLTDLSERRRFEQALIDADRKKDEFLATLAHELRNPLAPLRNGLQLLKRLPEGSEVAIKVREVMERQLGHMVHLIEDLLDVSRIRSGKVVLRLERVALSDVCATALEASRPVIEAGQHELRVHVPEDPIYLRVDHTRISQVISNLLNNAAKYTPPGGIIRLVVKREDQWLLISVSDNGLGIPKDMLPKVFTLFTQVEHGMNRAQGGLGIGLALVKKLVELHGGTVEVYSNGANQGSTFTVKLPFS
jgi:PAS domain S-box-containing protein